MTVCVVLTVCRRLLLQQQRPSPNLNVNCLTLIYRLFKLTLIVMPRMVVLKWLLIQPCSYHKLKRIFHCSLLLFLHHTRLNPHDKVTVSEVWCEETAWYHPARPIVAFYVNDCLESSCYNRTSKNTAFPADYDS